MCRGDRPAHRQSVRGGSMSERPPPFPSPPPPPPGTRPPPSDASLPRGVVLKGIAGSPGVAVGSALVVGDMRTAYARRHVSSAQIEAEVERLTHAVEDAKRHLREVSAKLPTGPLE